MIRRALAVAALSLAGLGPLQAAVEIHGLSGAERKNVEGLLDILRLPADAPALKVDREHRRARRQIRQALQALGYYNPEIEATLLRPEDAEWQAVYRIEAGPRTRIDTIDVRYAGPGAAELADATAGSELEGRPLHHDDYRQLKSRLLNRAFNQGYLDAEWAVSRLEIDRERNVATVRLHLQTGPAFQFGRIDVRQDILRPDFVARYIHINEGDPFRPDALLDLQLRLSDLGYFSSLDVNTERPDPDGNRIDVDIEAQPVKPQRYQLGLGFGTDTGPRFTGQIEFRHLNRRGHRLSNNLRLSQVQSAVSSEYLIPAGTVPGEHWSLRLGFNNERLGNTRTDEYQLGLARRRIVGPRIWRYYINYEREEFRLSQRSRATDVFTPGISLTLRRTDDDLNPRDGYNLFVDIHGAEKTLLSDTRFVQASIRTRLIKPLGERSRVLLRASTGANAVGSFSELPLSQRFFVGGDQSVRGYRYRSLGTRDAEGQIIGGQYFTELSAEVDRMLFRNYGAALFYDYGGAADSPGEGLKRGVGLGLRWRTAIGMVRADFAHPLDDRDRGIRIHIGVGAEL